MAEHDEAQERALIEAALSRAGYRAESWRASEENAGRAEAVVGRFRVLQDDDEAGLFADTEGVLTAVCVGSAERRNLRVAFGFLEDGMTADVEVRDLDALEAA
jgi:hypothetical protein